MIQRIQSIFLLLVGIAMVICTLTVAWAKSVGTQMVTLDAFSLVQSQGDKIINSTSITFIGILAALSSVVAFFSIFQYKNRLRQVFLGAINSLLMVTVMGTLLYYSFQGAALFEPAQRGNYSIGFYAVVAALICNVLANRFIRRDEKLVRSADRMR